MSTSKKDKILGSLFGFAIGDAMGATTEFMSADQIKVRYGRVDEILGGGWLGLKRGEVTDDTQMMMCIINALLANNPLSASECPSEEHRIIKDIRWNFIDWYRSCPPDVGGACGRAISAMIYEGIKFAPYDETVLGNGSLMRALPFALLGRKDFNIVQGRMTHNNIECDMYIEYYTMIVNAIVNSCVPKQTKEMVIEEPRGNVHDTFNNALFWSLHTESFEDSIICAVNHGGDADTIAAITGGISGAIHGFESIPKKWVNALDSSVAEKLIKFANYVERNCK